MRWGFLYNTPKFLYSVEDSQMANDKRPDSMARITTPALAKEFIDTQIQALRAQIGDGWQAVWTKTLMPEPPATFGMNAALSLASSAVGSSEIAAQVTGLGETASEATLTFRYGATQDLADGTVEVTVTDAGEWRGTIPHLRDPSSPHPSRDPRRRCSSSESSCLPRSEPPQNVKSIDEPISRGASAPIPCTHPSTRNLAGRVPGRTRPLQPQPQAG